MPLATIYITHRDGVRRRYALILTPLLRRLFSALCGRKKPAPANKA